MRTISVVTPPAIEPVTVADARLALGQDAGADAPVLDLRLRAARELAEAFTGRAFITTTFLVTLDSFPSAPIEEWWDGVRDGVPAWRRSSITLPRPPVQSITSIKYTDASGVEQTVDSGTYYLAGGRIMLLPAMSWPSYARTASVKVTFVSGYGDAPEDVPAGVRAGILAHVRDVTEHPNAAVTAERVDNASVTYGTARASGQVVESPGGLRGGAADLLRPYRVLRSGLA